MSIEALLERVPAYAKDLKLNLGGLLRQPELTQQQLWGTAVACAIAARNADVLKAVLADASAQLTPVALEAAKSAAAIMGMNNVYYRFLHLTPNEKYKTIPARLRMNVMRNHGADHVDFELWCTAISAINNCHTCVQSHERTLRDKGVIEETIIASIRLAAVLHSIATVLEAESLVPIRAPLSAR